MKRAAIVFTPLLLLLLVTSQTAAERSKRWNDPYVPTAMEWLALTMQASHGTNHCAGRSPPCVDISFAPGANALGIIMLYTKDKSELATVSHLYVEQLRRLTLATAEGMGYPPPEIFTGTIYEFLQQPAQRQLHLPNKPSRNLPFVKRVQ
jgi:hypothetical protein